MKRALFILLAIAAPLLAMAQPRYTVEKIPMCWTVSAVDSSVTKIVLISSVSDQLITIGYYNADGAEVTVSGGTLAYGYCGTGGGGGGGDDDWRWYVPGDDTYAQPLYRVGKTNIFVTNAADTLHGFRVDSTFQFRMDGGRDIFDWQVGGGTGYDFTPHAGLFYRAPGTFEQNGLGSGHNQITLGLDDSTILSRDRLGAIVFAGRNPSGTGGYRPGAMITAFADGNWYGDSSSTSINFYVTRPNQTTMNNVVTFERGGRVELDYYQTFEDGIPERMIGFTNLSDDLTAHTITGTPGANKVLGINEYNTAMTWKDPGDVVQAETRHIVYQPAHGFTLPAHGFIPVYLDTITGWELALAADSLTLHDSYIVEVISVDTFVLQEAGILRVPAGHGLTPGSDYFLTDVGGIATTPGFHNDWLATVWDTITLALKATRPVLGAVADTTVYLQGAGTANQVAYYADNDSLASSSEFQFNGTNVAVGTAPVASNKFIVQGDGATSSTNGIVHQNNSGNNTFTLRDDGTILARYLGRTPGAGTEGTTMLWSLNSNISDSIPSTTRYGLYNNIQYTFGNTVGNANSKISGVYSNANFSTSGNGRLANIRAFEGVVSTSQTSQVLTGSMYGAELSFSNAITGLSNNIETGGLYISGTNSGRILNTYGIRIGDITSGTQDNQAYSLYTGDLSARNYFGGNNQLGSDATSNYTGVGVTPSNVALMHVKGPSASGGRPRLFIGASTSPAVHTGGGNFNHAAITVYSDFLSDTKGVRQFSDRGQTGILAIASQWTQSSSHAIYGYNSIATTPITFNQYTTGWAGYFLNRNTATIGQMTNGLNAANRKDWKFYGIQSESNQGITVNSNDLGISPNTYTWGGYFIAVAPTNTADASAANIGYGIQTSATNGKINYGVYSATTGSATLNVGVFSRASGASNNWAVYGSAGDIGSAGSIIVNPSIATTTAPTANVDINGSLRLQAASTPGSVEDGETWTSSAQKALVSNQAGITQSLIGTIFTGTADATVANTVTETSIVPTGVGTVTLPANFLVAGKTIKIDAWGIWEADTSASTLELRVELGGTLLCTTGAQTMVTCEGGEWHMEAIVTCRTTGASGTTYSQGEVDFMSAFTTSVKHWMRRSATNTIDTTVSNVLDVTATHGTADPDNLITTTNITVTVLN